MAIDDNFFIEQFLPSAITRKLSEVEMHHNRAPFLEPSSRKPLYRFPNDVPIAGEPAEVYSRVEAANEWLLANDLPKLLFAAQPGIIVPEDVAKWYTEHLHNSRTVDLGPGLHYV